MRRYSVLILLLFACSAKAQQALTMFGVSGIPFVAPHVESQSSYKLFDPSWIVAQMPVSANDTLQITAGRNSNQKYTLILSPSANDTVRFDSTIVYSSTTLALTSGTTYVCVFYYYSTKWYLEPSIIGVPSSSGVTTVSGTSPIASSGGSTPAISIANAVADGSTKGAASFAAADFNSSSGNIFIDYTNGQAASGMQNGFLSSSDWTTFNNKGSGTVTSITVTGANGIGVSGSPITTSGTIGLSLSTLTGTTWNGNKISEAYGGTNQSTYTTGDILYATGANTLGKLPIGTANQVLEVSGGIPTWVSSTTTATIQTWVDTLTLNGQTKKDTTLGTPLLIAATTEPAQPQFFYVLKASDIPTDTLVNTYTAYVTIGGLNTTAGGVGIFVQGCRGNAVNTDIGGTQAHFTATASQNWVGGVGFHSKAVNAGDTLGVKMWAATTNVLDIRRADIYVIYRTIGAKRAGDFYNFTYYTIGASAPISQTAFAGAIAGVSYTNMATPVNAVMDSTLGTGNGVLDNFGRASYPSQVNVVLGYGQYMCSGATSPLTDDSALLQTSNASPILGQLQVGSSSAGRIRTFRIYRIK